MEKEKEQRKEELESFKQIAADFLEDTNQKVEEIIQSSNYSNEDQCT